MRILEKEFTSCGFTFKQVHREGNFAIYSKIHPQHSRPSYEVIAIRNHNGYSIAGVFCPASEMYPSNEKWGTDGFTCQTKEEAYIKFDKMKNRKEEFVEVDGEMKKKRGRPKGGKNKD